MKQLIFFVFALIMLNACAQNKQVSSTISVEAFQSLQQTKPDLIVLDIRTPEETARGKIKGAIELDYMDLSFEKKVLQLDKSKPITVYCATGYRSGEAVAYMKANGFKEVYDLQGGIIAWQRMKLPLVK